MNDIRTVISDNIKRIEDNIARCVQNSGRSAEDITLVAVTKNQPPEYINIALENGIKCIGENRVQELLGKFGAVKPGQWHLIGHLQTNKVNDVVGKVSMIQSVDSLRLLDAIENQSKKIGIVSEVLLQVNTSGEESKFGASVEDLYKLVEKAQILENVKVRGLMTIAPLCNSAISNRLHFANTNKIYIDIKSKTYNNINMDYLSMGMSGDYEDAILEGSNMVRIGSSIFKDN